MSFHALTRPSHYVLPAQEDSDLPPSLPHVHDLRVANELPRNPPRPLGRAPGPNSHFFQQYHRPTGHLREEPLRALDCVFGQTVWV